MQRKNHPVVFLGLLLLLLSLSACETLRGAGRDVENAGDPIEEFTEDVTD